MIQSRIIETCIVTCFILIFAYTKTEIRLDIPEEERLKAEQKIEKTLTSETIYDVKCVLEKIDSGYNILIINQAEPESIQSFIDPTIVAWYLADKESNSCEIILPAGYDLIDTNVC